MKKIVSILLAIFIMLLLPIIALIIASVVILSAVSSASTDPGNTSIDGLNKFVL